MPGFWRLLRNLLIVAVLTAAAIFGVAWFWSLIGGDSLTVNGWIAVSLGVFFTFALTWGLMSLAFRSSREGFDQRAVDLSDLNIAPHPPASDAPAPEGEETRDIAKP